MKTEAERLAVDLAYMLLKQSRAIHEQNERMALELQKKHEDREYKTNPYERDTSGLAIHNGNK